MTRLRHNWTPLAITYFILALIGGAMTWTLNIGSFTTGGNYFGEWFGSGPAVLSLAVDVLWVALAAIIVMIVEARRLGMRHVWVYVIAVFAVALAFSFPLFLCMRERQLARDAAQGTAHAHEQSSDSRKLQPSVITHGQRG